MNFTAIVALITKLLSVISSIIGFFKKSPTEEIEDKKKKIDEEFDKFKDTGRPGS